MSGRKGLSIDATPTLLGDLSVDVNKKDLKVVVAGAEEVVRVSCDTKEKEREKKDNQIFLPTHILHSCQDSSLVSALTSSRGETRES